MKAQLLLIICVLISAAGFAQKRNIYFLNDKGKYISTRDSADYIRIISKPDSGSTLYNIAEYYTKTGKVKFVGKNRAADDLYLEGQSISYYPSGDRKLMASYTDNKLDGDVYQYYPNGRLYSSLKFVAGKSSIISCNDSTGKALVVDGKGHFIGFDNDFKNIIQEGEVIHGKPEGDWITRQFINDEESNTLYSTTYKDRYVDGNFIVRATISSTVKPGDSSRVFKKVNIQPEYPGGVAALGKFLQKNIRYPVSAFERHITGKVYLTFFIETDGGLTDITVVSSPDNDLSKEAIRVMNLSPHWKPGVLDGKPVRVKFTMPVNFSLAN
jgi:TonB family protein